MINNSTNKANTLWLFIRERVSLIRFKMTNPEFDGGWAQNWGQGAFLFLSLSHLF